MDPRFTPVILKPSHENAAAIDGLQDRLNMLKRENDIHSSGGLLSGTADKVKKFKTRMKSKTWAGKEEEALARAWIDITKDSAHSEPGNPQRSDSFWKRVLAHFEAELGSTERNVHQLNSKWKDMNSKMTRFNNIYNDKLTNRLTGQSNEDILKETYKEYKKLHAVKVFPHESTWDIVKNNPIWTANMKTSDSNTCSKSSEAEFPVNLEEPRKRKKSVSLSSLIDQQELVKIVSEFISFSKEDMENKKHVRGEKLRLLKEKHESKMLLHQAEMRMLQEQQKDKDMEFILKPHDHLDGVMLKVVLARKREIAQRWGWE